MMEEVGKLPSQSSLHDHPQAQERDPSAPPHQLLEMNDDHHDLIGIGESYKGVLDDQEDHQSIGSAVTANSLGAGGSLEDLLVDKLMMRNNNHSNSDPTSTSNSMVLDDSMRSRKSIGSTTTNNNNNNNNKSTINNSNSVAFNDSGRASKKSTGTNITANNNNNNNPTSTSATNSHHLDTSSGHVRAFEAMLADLQVYPTTGSNGSTTTPTPTTGVSVHKRIPGWKLTKGSDRREALVQSLLAAAATSGSSGSGGGGNGGDGDLTYARSRPTTTNNHTTTNHTNNDRIIAPGRLVGVGVGVDTLPPSRTHSQPPSRSQYNSRASPPPSPPRSTTTSNNNRSEKLFSTYPDHH